MNQATHAQERDQRPIPFKVSRWGWPPLRLVDEDPIKTIPRVGPPLSDKKGPFFNTRQVIAIRVALLLLCSMALFPPWEEVVSSPGRSYARDRGYGLLFLSPRPTYLFGTVVLDFRRLGLQAGAVVIATLAALWLTHKPIIQEEPLLPFEQH